MSRICVSVMVGIGTAVFALLGIAAEPALIPVPDPGAQVSTGASKAASPKLPARSVTVGPREGNPHFGYPPQPRPDTRKPLRVVYRLKNVPASDAAKAINELLRSEPQLRGPQGPAFQASSATSIKIVAEPVSNTLLIAGPSDMVDEIRKIVSDLDVAPATVLIEVVIGEAPAFKAKAAETPKPDRAAAAPSGKQSLHVIAAPPQMETVARVRLATLDNQPAFIQLGQRIPLLGGGRAPAPAGKQRRPGLTNVGLIVGLTPRVSPDGPVVMEVDVEKSHVGPEPGGTPTAAGDQAAMLGIETTQVQTTVRVPNGQTIVLGSITERGKQDKELYIVLTPQVLETEKSKKPK